MFADCILFTKQHNCQGWFRVVFTIVILCGISFFNLLFIWIAFPIALQRFSCTLHFPNPSRVQFNCAANKILPNVYSLSRKLHNFQCLLCTSLYIPTRKFIASHHVTLIRFCAEILWKNIRWTVFGKIAGFICQLFCENSKSWLQHTQTGILYDSE